MKAAQLLDKETTKIKVPEFRAGDNLKVYLKVKEGDKSRIQLFEGVCIRRRGSGAGASFTVIKETHGDIVEKIFPLYSPSIDKIKVSRKGTFKRAKLYYLRNQK